MKRPAALPLTIFLLAAGTIWIWRTAADGPPRATAVVPPPAPKSAPASVDPALIEPGRDGPLPRVAADGRQPLEAYAAPFEAPERPLIAIVVTDLGLDKAVSLRAIDELPTAVTLAFSPYAAHLEGLAGAARAKGHETLVSVPMESAAATRDPGPSALLVDNSPAENDLRFKWALSRFTGYVGVITHMGGRFTAAAGPLGPVLRETRDRGLLFIDARRAEESAVAGIARGIGLVWATADRRLDEQASAAAIDAQLKGVEALAKRNGAAVAIAGAHPLVVDRVAAWAQGLYAKGLALAPITAVAGRQGGKQ
jgi:hypothetical protein